MSGAARVGSADLRRSHVSPEPCPLARLLQRALQHQYALLVAASLVQALPLSKLCLLLRLPRSQLLRFLRAAGEGSHTSAGLHRVSEAQPGLQGNADSVP